MSVSFCAAEVTVRQIDGPVKIDGIPDEAVWKECQPLSLAESTSSNLSNTTTVQLARDSRYFYLAFVCYEKRMDRLVANWTHDEERDNNIWTDDCVEIFLAPWGNRQRFYHIAVNASGVIYDTFGTDSSWNAEISASATKHPDRWVLEMRIPLKDLGLSTMGGDIWLGNFCREEKSFDENTSLFPTPKGFNDPESFREITFAPLSDNLNFTLKQISGKRISALIGNTTGKTQKIRLSLANPDKNQDAILQKDIDLKVSDKNFVTFKYTTPPGTGNIDIEVKKLRKY
jgi:hypothetical protein